MKTTLEFKKKKKCLDVAELLFFTQSWKWRDGTDEAYVPNRKRLLKGLTRLEKIVKKQHCKTSTGRLLVFWKKNRVRYAIVPDYKLYDKEK